MAWPDSISTVSAPPTYIDMVSWHHCMGRSWVELCLPAPALPLTYQLVLSGLRVPPGVFLVGASRGCLLAWRRSFPTIPVCFPSPDRRQTPVYAATRLSFRSCANEQFGVRRWPGDFPCAYLLSAAGFLSPVPWLPQGALFLRINMTWTSTYVHISP